MRPNSARSKVRSGHDVNNCKLIAGWLKLAQLYKLVAEWLFVNIQYGYVLRSQDFSQDFSEELIYMQYVGFSQCKRSTIQYFE